MTRSNTNDYFTSIGYQQSAVISAAYYSNTDAIAAVYAKRVFLLDSSNANNVCRYNTDNSTYSTCCGYLDSTLPAGCTFCHANAVQFGGTPQLTDNFTISSVSNTNDVLIPELTYTNNQLSSSSYQEILSNFSQAMLYDTTAAYGTNCPSSATYQNWVWNGETPYQQYCCNTSSDPFFLNASSAFGLSSSNGYNMYVFSAPVGVVKLDDSYYVSNAVYNTPWKAVLQTFSSSGGMCQFFTAVFILINLAHQGYIAWKRQVKRRKAIEAAAEANHNIVRKEPLRKRVKKWIVSKDHYDAFADIAINLHASTYVGLFISLGVIPCLLGVYGYYFFITHLNSPKQDYTTYNFLELGTVLDIPFSCGTLDGCVVQTRSTTGDVLTPIDYNHTVYVSITVNDTSIPIAVVWPRRVTFQTNSTINTLTSCVKEPVTAYCAAHYYDTNCLVPTVVIGGEVTYNSNDSFSVVGSTKNNQTIMPYIVNDGGIVSTKFVKVSSNVGSSFNPYIAVGGNYSPDDYCGFVENNTFLPTLLTAFNIQNSSVLSNYTKYDAISYLGLVKLSDKYLVQNVTYYSSQEITLTAVSSIAGLYSGLLMLGCCIVVFLREVKDLITGKDGNSDEPELSGHTRKSKSRLFVLPDSFAKVKRLNETKSRCGILSTFVLAPLLWILYAYYSYQQFFNTPMSVETSFEPLPLGTNFYLPVTCNSPSGCILQNKMSDGDVFTPIAAHSKSVVNVELLDSEVGIGFVWPNRVQYVQSYNPNYYCVNTTTVAYVTNNCGAQPVYNYSTGNISCAQNISMPFWEPLIMVGGQLNPDTDSYYIINGSSSEQRLVATLTYEANLLVSSSFSPASTKKLKHLPPFPAYNSSLEPYSCISIAKLPQPWKSEFATAFQIDFSNTQYTMINFQNYINQININPDYIRNSHDYYLPGVALEKTVSAVGGAFASIMSALYFLVYFTRLAIQYLTTKKTSNGNVKKSGHVAAEQHATLKVAGDEKNAVVVQSF